MLGIWNFFINKNRFTYLLIAILSVAGIGTMLAIPKESAPEVKVPVGIVTTFLPGGSPEDVELLITNEIEDGVSGLSNVKKFTSTSRESISSVVVEFEASADIDKSIQDLKDKIDTVRPKLPKEAEDPMVSEVDFTDQPILFVSIFGELPPSEFQRVASELEDEIEKITGVSRVEVQGSRDREVQVIINKEQLSAFGLRLNDVVGAIRAANSSLPTGSIEVNGISYAVRFEGDIEKPEEIGDIALLSAGGEPVYLRDIAFVSDGVERETTLSRVSVDGEPSKPAVTLSVFNKTGGDIIETDRLIRERVKSLKTTTLQDVEVLFTFATADFIKDDLTNLSRSGLQTIILVMIVLLVFVGWRESLIAGGAIPLSFLISFVGLYISGNTINFISLFSLILAIGILVDSAIVVVEAMHTKIDEGKGRIAAAREALDEYSWPLISGTMTTIAAFFPLFFISGVTGEFISVIPFTIISVLTASIFVALAFIPIISAGVIRPRNGNGGKMAYYQEYYTEVAHNFYREKLNKLLDNRRRQKYFIGAIIILLVVSITLPITGLLKVIFFPQEDSPFIFVEVSRQLGTSLQETDLSVRAAEEILYSELQIESFTTSVGAGSSFGGSGGSGEHLANITITLRDDREETSSQILQKLRTEMREIKQADIQLFEPESGPPTGAPVVIEFSGGSAEDLERAANKAEQALKEIPGTTEVLAGTKDNGIEFVLKIDRARASQLGLTPAAVAQTLRTAIQGETATDIRQGKEDIEVRVSLNLNPDYRTPEEVNRTTIDAIRNLELVTPKGTVLLDSIVTVSLGSAEASITHEDGERVVNVESYLEEGVVASDITAAFSEKFDRANLPAGVSMSVGGENEEVDQSFAEMFYALIAGIFLIALILVVQFNSLRYSLFVILVPPFSLAGLLIGLTLTGQTLSFPSLMGFITLAGIVVNNGIILIDAAERFQTTMSRREAMVEACVSRLRPILMTTITTVVGIFPLIFASAIWGPLAWAVIFGLSYSLILTLVFIPILYDRWGKKKV